MHGRRIQALTMAAGCATMHSAISIGTVMLSCEQARSCFAVSGQMTLSSRVRGRLDSGLKAMTEAKWLGGSIVAWVSLGITLVGFAVTYGATQATINGELGSLKYQTTRNREEASDRIKSIEASVNNLYTSMASIHSIKTDVEVIKAEMKSLNEAMRRLERRDRMPDRLPPR